MNGDSERSIGQAGLNGKVKTLGDTFEHNLEPESDNSSHHYRLPFHELSVFEQALFVGFGDVPVIPAYLHARDGRTGDRHTSVPRGSPRSAAWQAAMLGIIAVLGLVLLLLLPAGDPELMDAGRADYSLAIEMELEPALNARGGWMMCEACLHRSH